MSEAEFSQEQYLAVISLATKTAKQAEAIAIASQAGSDHYYRFPRLYDALVSGYLATGGLFYPYVVRDVTNPGRSKQIRSSIPNMTIDLADDGYTLTIGKNQKFFPAHDDHDIQQILPQWADDPLRKLDQHVGQAVNLDAVKKFEPELVDFLLMLNKESSGRLDINVRREKQTGNFLVYSDSMI